METRNIIAGSHWIDPKNELPPMGEIVLVVTCVRAGFFDFDNICDHGGWLKNSYSDDRTKSDVVFWMRIPKIPTHKQ